MFNNSSRLLTPPVENFAGLPVCRHLDELEADIAILGLHYVSPYPRELEQAADHPTGDTAPDAIRRKSSVFIDHWDHWDFDFDDLILAGQKIRIVDCGDVDRPIEGVPRDPDRITRAVRAILNAGTVPIAVGTDEGGFIPFARAYESFKNLCVVHLDAHIDWRDQRHGVKEGYSSGMRRVSEMPWVRSMAQIGLRGIGSARRQEIDDARAFGSVFIRARDLHEKGANACIERIPAADQYLITIDADVLDVAMAPGVLFPSPGGLTFEETTEIVRMIALRGSIAGIGLFEVRPERDINGLTATTAAQLIVNFIGSLARGRMNR